MWHGQAPRILSTFAESYDFDGLTIIPFCTSGGSGIGSSAEVLAEQAGSGSWLDGERFSAGAARETLADWIDGLALEAAGQ
ncbi:MAG: flavodoxin [[Clostridium] leptum]